MKSLKTKFIGILAAVVVILALFAFAVPAMASPDVDMGPGEMIAAPMMTAGLATLDSTELPPMAPDVDVGIAEIAAPAPALSALVQFTDKDAQPAPADTAQGSVLWLALSATLVTLAVAKRRTVHLVSSTTSHILRRMSGMRTSGGTGHGGGPNRCILPASRQLEPGE